MFYRNLFLVSFFLFVSSLGAKSLLIPSEKSILIQAILKECPTKFKSIRLLVINDGTKDSKSLFEMLNKTKTLQVRSTQLYLETHFLSLKEVLNKLPSYDLVYSSIHNDVLYNNYKLISDNKSHLVHGALIVLMKEGATPKVYLNLNTSQKYSLTFPTSFMRFVNIYNQKDES